MSNSPVANAAPSPLPCLTRAGTEAGERVLAGAVQRAHALWGKRLVSAYAIGSLAHGGFSPHVSDVDLALVLEAPLDDEDAAHMRLLLEASAASSEALAKRLSVFWGSCNTLAGAADGGRFPPADRLDLWRHGRLLAGRETRDRIKPPTLRELVSAGAAFAHRVLSGPEPTAYLFHPERLAAAPVRTLTKLTLYPVRLLYTARTGEVGINGQAVDHFTMRQTGPAAQLALHALRWRHEPPVPGERAVIGLLQQGLMELYRTFLDEYERRLRGYGETDLAIAYRDWALTLNK